MEYSIRDMREADRDAVLVMMRAFYHSPAVLSNGSEEIFAADVEACLSAGPYLAGYVFEGADGALIGYAMVARSFSTEFGKPCLWIEDLYLREGFRGRGAGSAFLRFIECRHPGALLRLEAERENERAIGVYRRGGFSELPYPELIK